MASHNPVPDITVDTTYGVCAAAGFRAAGVEAGFKASGGKDLALVVNDGPEFNAAAVFTSNRVAAAPVHWSREVIRQGTCRAVILNSGGANACTGAQGFQNTHETAELVAEKLGVGAGDVVVCSTGLIGEQLPMDVMKAGIPAVTDALAAGPDAGKAAAEAIMTTDSVSKQACAARDGWTVGGIAKGAGMLAPGLATMLVVITTDAKLPADALDRALREACRVTFNRTDSDGCMSTNDTVLLLASGASGIEPDPDEFNDLIANCCASLARQIIGDGEGASHDIRITVAGATSEDAALACGRAIAASNLLKCAISGNDPNWGRIVSSLGTVPADVAPYDPDEVTVDVNGVRICDGGKPGHDRSEVDMTPRQIDIDVDLHAGTSAATVWTDDLTHEYVHINADYES